MAIKYLVPLDSLYKLILENTMKSTRALDIEARRKQHAKDMETAALQFPHPNFYVPKFPKNKQEFINALDDKGTRAYYKGYEVAKEEAKKMAETNYQMLKEKRELINAMAQAAQAHSDLIKSITYICNSCIPK